MSAAAAPTAPAPPLIELRGISKSFGNVSALSDVNCTIEAGEVVGVLGDNGAGKSTLIKILAGVHQPDSGQLLWDGEPRDLKSPADAIALGISVAYQHLAIVDQMTVWRNLFLGHEAEISRTVGPFRGPLRLLKTAGAKEAGAKALESLGIHIRDIDETVESLSGGQRQSIAIARAVLFESRLLILDEPTSALSLKETDKVLGYVRNAKNLGISVVIITHNIRHAMQVSDSFLVLHHGRAVLRCKREEVAFTELSDVITTGGIAARS